MSDKTLIEWNADVGTRFLTIYPDGSFHINENTPPLYALGELAKAFMRQQDRIQRLEEQLMDAKNKRAVLVADVVLNEDRAERIKRLEETLDKTTKIASQRIKRLEDRIHRASMAFFRDGSDGHVASQMLQILEEERKKL